MATVNKMQPLLNRYVWIGACGSCVWSAIVPLVPLRLEVVTIGVAEIQAHRALSQQEQQSVVLFGVCVLVLLLLPLGIGWFVARASTWARIGAQLSNTARFSALGGGLAVGLGMLPLTMLIVFWELGRSMLTGDVSGMLAWLVAVSLAVSLGALGGALYFWTCGRKIAISRGMSKNAEQEFEALS